MEYKEKHKKVHIVHVPKPVFIKKPVYVTVEKKVPVVKIKPVFVPKPIIVKKIQKVPVIKKVHIIQKVKVPVIKKVPYPVPVKKIKVSTCKLSRPAPDLSLSLPPTKSSLLTPTCFSCPITDRQGSGLHQGEEEGKVSPRHVLGAIENNQPQPLEKLE